jgi:hypothetical protein
MGFSSKSAISASLFSNYVYWTRLLYGTFFPFSANILPSWTELSLDGDSSVNQCETHYVYQKCSPRELLSGNSLQTVACRKLLTESCFPTVASQQLFHGKPLHPPEKLRSTASPCSENLAYTVSKKLMHTQEYIQTFSAEQRDAEVIKAA